MINQPTIVCLYQTAHTILPGMPFNRFAKQGMPILHAPTGNTRGWYTTEWNCIVFISLMDIIHTWTECLHDGPRNTLYVISGFFFLPSTFITQPCSFRLLPELHQLWCKGGEAMTLLTQRAHHFLYRCSTLLYLQTQTNLRARIYKDLENSKTDTYFEFLLVVR